VTRVPSATSTSDDADPTTPPADDDVDRAALSADDRADNIEAIAPLVDSEPVPMSLDRDASDRTFDRQLAYLGLLDDAAPSFARGRRFRVPASC
jgi:hypothetical protein